MILRPQSKRPSQFLDILFNQEYQRINYPIMIDEEVDELRQLERQLRGQPTAPRVQLLRLLKSGQVTTLGAAASVLGYHERHLSPLVGRLSSRWAGATARLPHRPGRVSRMTAAAWHGLEAAMTAGEIVTLKDAQRYLAETWDVHYQSLNGVWEQLRVRQAKKKTGRRRHRQANAEAQENYKR